MCPRCAPAFSWLETYSHLLALRACAGICFRFSVETSVDQIVPRLQRNRLRRLAISDPTRQPNSSAG